MIIRARLCRIVPAKPEALVTSQSRSHCRWKFRLGVLSWRWMAAVIPIVVPLGVAACNHQAFYSQTYAISAQIICEWRRRNTHALCERARIICDMLAIIVSCSHWLRMTLSAAVHWEPADSLTNVRFQDRCTNAPVSAQSHDFARLRTLSSNHGMVDAVFQPFPDIAPRTTKGSISSVMRFKRLGASEFSKI